MLERGGVVAAVNLKLKTKESPLTEKYMRDGEEGGAANPRGCRP